VGAWEQLARPAWRVDEERVSVRNQPEEHHRLSVLVPDRDALSERAELVWHHVTELANVWEQLRGVPAVSCIRGQNDRNGRPVLGHVITDEMPEMMWVPEHEAGRANPDQDQQKSGGRSPHRPVTAADQAAKRHHKRNRKDQQGGRVQGRDRSADLDCQTGDDPRVG